MIQLVRSSAGYVYRDIFSLGKRLLMKSFHVTMNRDGDVTSDKKQLTDSEGKT